MSFVVLELKGWDWSINLFALLAMQRQTKTNWISFRINYFDLINYEWRADAAVPGRWQWFLLVELNSSFFSLCVLLNWFKIQRWTYCTCWVFIADWFIRHTECILHTTVLAGPNIHISTIIEFRQNVISIKMNININNEPFCTIFCGPIENEKSKVGDGFLCIDRTRFVVHETPFIRIQKIAKGLQPT